MAFTKKTHGWLVGALNDVGYQQRDLAKAWRVDDAVVSRFIATGKPDLTPERQMVLASILKMTSDQLLGKLYGGVPLGRAIPFRTKAEQQEVAPSSNSNSGGIEQAHAELKRAIEHLQELMPDAMVTVTITYGGQ